MARDGSAAEPADQQGLPEEDDDALRAWVHEQLATNPDALDQLQQLLGIGDQEAGETATPAAMLLAAASDGNLATVQELLQGPDGQALINASGPDGDTPLHCASLYGQAAVVDLLLQRDADAGAVNAQDGSTPLHDAAASGEADILQQLLPRAGHRVNHQDEDGETPLHCAARGNHAACVQLLLQAGSNRNLQNNDGQIPLQLAEDADVIALLQT